MFGLMCARVCVCVCVCVCVEKAGTSCRLSAATVIMAGREMRAAAWGKLKKKIKPISDACLACLHHQGFEGDEIQIKSNPDVSQSKYYHQSCLYIIPKLVSGERERVSSLKNHRYQLFSVRPL